jgi:hypothetical protein
MWRRAGRPTGHVGDLAVDGNPVGVPFGPIFSVSPR